MKPFFKNALLRVLAIAGIAFGSSADAIVVSYTVDGVAPQQFASPVTPPSDAYWGVNGYPGDTVELKSYTGSFNLAVGTSVQTVNSLLWTVNFTYGGTATDSTAWSDMPFDLNATRQIHLGDSTAVLSQAGSLNADWDTDYLEYYDGSTVTLYDQGYRIDITPLGLPSTAAINLFDGENPWAQAPQEMLAKFVVTDATAGLVSAPEPGTIAALVVLGMVSCGGSVVSRLRLGNRRAVGSVA